MPYRPIYKQYLLYSALLVTLSATAYYKYQDSLKDQSGDVVRASIINNYVGKTANKAESNMADEKKGPLAKVDIFEVYKKPAPEPAVKEAIKPNVVTKAVPVIAFTPPAPVTPTAPLVPFKYIGKLFGDDEYQVFVGFNGKYLTLKEGDVVQQTYKIEKITPPVMTLTYIPMNILQNMQIGEPN